jgi:hypothetical protein
MPLAIADVSDAGTITNPPSVLLPSSFHLPDIMCRQEYGMDGIANSKYCGATYNAVGGLRVA